MKDLNGGGRTTASRTKSETEMWTGRRFAGAATRNLLTRTNAVTRVATLSTHAVDHSSIYRRKISPCGSYWVESAAPLHQQPLYIGVTKDCFDNDMLGDVDAVSYDPTAGALKLEWSGLAISDGDELYHTVWKNVEGTTTLPVKAFTSAHNCRVEVNKVRPTYHTCEKDWLLRVHTDA
jgi:hypothetical protein